MNKLYRSLTNRVCQFFMVALIPLSSWSQDLVIMPGETFKFDRSLGSVCVSGPVEWATTSQFNGVDVLKYTGETVPANMVTVMASPNIVSYAPGGPRPTMSFQVKLSDAAASDRYIVRLRILMTSPTCPYGLPPTEGTLDVPIFVYGQEIYVTSADLKRNTFTVVTPAEQQGTLALTPQGKNNFPRTVANEGQVLQGGNITMGLERYNIPGDRYSSLVAEWTPAAQVYTTQVTISSQNTTVEVKSSTTPIRSAPYVLAVPWDVKGVVRYSQYNTPIESQCTGTPKEAYVVSAATCQFDKTTFDSSFISQVYINGTGKSTQHGTIKYIGAVCKGKFPDGATKQNSFLKVPSVTGACNIALTGEKSLATYPNPRPNNQCSAGELLVNKANKNHATRQVDDYCPACSSGFNGTEGHTDAYSAVTACSGHAVGDLGNFWTYRTK